MEILLPFLSHEDKVMLLTSVITLSRSITIALHKRKEDIVAYVLISQLRNNSDIQWLSDLQRHTTQLYTKVAQLPEKI